VKEAACLVDTFRSRSKHGPVERAFCVETQRPAAPIEGTETSRQIVQPIKARVQGVMAELVIAQGVMANVELVLSVNGRAVTVNSHSGRISPGFLNYLVSLTPRRPADGPGAAGRGALPAAACNHAPGGLPGHGHRQRNTAT
jgi:hypothetical protein